MNLYIHLKVREIKKKKMELNHFKVHLELLLIVDLKIICQIKNKDPLLDNYQNFIQKIEN